jgi:hypothetical protein
MSAYALGIATGILLAWGWCWLNRRISARQLMAEAIAALQGAAEPNGELQRLRAENEVLRTGFFQLADFADQQRQSVMGRLAENRTGKHE